MSPISFLAKDSYRGGIAFSPMDPFKELEEIVDNNSDNKYRSRGERQIAFTLREYGIPFTYEPRLKLEYAGRTHNLRPDFVLPELQIIVEYYGLVGKPDYDKRTKLKQRIYASHNLNILAVYPWDLVRNWPNDFIKEMTILVNRYHDNAPEVDPIVWTVNRAC